MIQKSLNDNFKITINDKHFANGEIDETTTDVAGEFVFGKNGYTIKYLDNEGTFEGSVTKIMVMEPDIVRVSRGGDMAIELLLENDKRHNCVYDTPFGNLQMAVYTEYVKSDMTSNGGRLSFKYSIDVGGEQLSDNELFIEVKERKNV